MPITFVNGTTPALSAANLNLMQGEITSALSTTGTYSARPAATSLQTGALYFATDTLETYRATGTAGSAATSWAVVGPGGSELAYAESLTTFAVTSTTPVDVTGLTITFTPGERPVKLEFGALLNIKATPGEAIIRIMDGTTSLREIHSVSPNTAYYVDCYGSLRKSFTAGTSKTLKIMALKATANFDIAGGAEWPMWIRASTL